MMPLVIDFVCTAAAAFLGTVVALIALIRVLTWGIKDDLTNDGSPESADPRAGTFTG